MSGLQHSHTHQQKMSQQDSNVVYCSYFRMERKIVHITQASSLFSSRDIFTSPLYNIVARAKRKSSFIILCELIWSCNWLLLLFERSCVTKTSIYAQVRNKILCTALRSPFLQIVSNLYIWNSIVALVRSHWSTWICFFETLNLIYCTYSFHFGANADGCKYRLLVSGV
jgi:hypothetical protein